MKIVNYAAALLILFSIRLATAQQNKFQFGHLSIDNGLAQSSPLCIHQDKTGFMWFGTYDGLNKYDGYDFAIFTSTVSDSTSISNNEVRAIAEDKNGYLWIGTNEGLNKYDPAAGNFIRFYSGEKKSLCNNNVRTLCVDSKGTIWIGTRNGLSRYDPEHNKFINYLDSIQINALCEYKNELWIATKAGLYVFRNEVVELVKLNYFESGNAISSLYASENTLWVGSWGKGLFQYDEKTNALLQPYKPLREAKYVQAITGDGQGNILVGSWGDGLFDYFVKNEKLVTDHWQTKQDPANKDGLKENYIYSLFQDRSGILWIGTAINGLNKLSRKYTHFYSYQHDPQDAKSISTNLISSFAEDKENNVWIGMLGGLNKLNRITGKVVRYGKLHGLAPNELINTICVMKNGDVWLGTSGNGIFINYKGTDVFVRFSCSKCSPFVVVLHILEDSAGNIWIGTDGSGLIRYIPSSKEIKISTNAGKNSLCNNVVRELFEDKEGNIWIGTVGGLSVLNSTTHEFRNYNAPGQISNNDILSITSDRNGTVWVGTAGGLNQYEKKSGKFICYTEEDGLINEIVSGIAEDRKGNLWLSTHNGILKFNPEAKSMRQYTKADGLQDNEFVNGAFAKTRSGHIFFGGINGFNYFHPDSIFQNAYIPETVFTNFTVLNKDVSRNNTESGIALLDQSGSQMKHLVLDYQHNMFSVEFASLDYNVPEKNLYAYKLEGFDQDWVLSTSKRRFATYSNLEYGTYIFRVKSSNNDGIWNEKGNELKITITPPYWKTWWAYVLYLFSGVFLLFGILRFRNRREKLKSKLKEESQEKQRLMEMDKLKTEFYTNISHELRTPLTLILAPLEGMVEAGQTNAISMGHINMIYTNTRRLIRLINQLMDADKADKNKLTLFLVEKDIVPFAKHIYESFTYYAAQHEITYTFYSEMEEQLLRFDSDKFDVILYNLLSNAFKFTGKGGKISVSLYKEDHFIKIAVQDTGSGIPAGDLAHIFERYYQVQGHQSKKMEGTGIGLSFTKDLVALHHGTIDVESTVGKGSMFTVRIPFIQVNKEETIQEKDSHYSTENSFSVKSTEVPTVLVVEDNYELRKYVAEILSGNYKVLQAADGMQGLAIAALENPDLIITDIMMPEMDGLEFCKKLKSDINSSHIPVIMLTAYLSLEQEIEGIHSGADAYITKPFSTKLLLARINNLLESRRKLKERFRLDPEMPSSGLAYTSADEQFISTLSKLIEENFETHEFDTEWLSKELNTSHATLYRKVKSLTGYSIKEFIDSVRIKHAAVLLKNTKLSIKEITYIVGYSDPKYFTKRFKLQFHKSPLEFRKENSSL